MKSLKKFAYEKPVLFSIIVMLVSVGITFIPLNSFFVGNMNEQAAGYASGVVEQTLISVLLIILLSKMQLLDAAGFHLRVKQLWLVWPMVLIALLDALELFDGTRKIDTGSKATIIMYILVYLSTGLFEETLCRGLVQTLFLQKWGKTKKGIYASVILCSLLFGMFHLIHFFTGQMSLLASVAQVIYATFIGVFMGACVLRNRSIFPTMLLHGLIDITGSLSEIAVNGGIPTEMMTISVANAVESVALMLPILLYGLFILRKTADYERVEVQSEQIVDCG